MSEEGVVNFLEKALNDEAFKAQVKSDPDKALSQFDLTEEEKSAIKNGSEDQLKAREWMRGSPKVADSHSLKGYDSTVGINGIGPLAEVRLPKQNNLQDNPKELSEEAVSGMMHGPGWKRLRSVWEF